MDIEQLMDQGRQLASLQDQFPDYALWQERGRDRMLFHSRSRSLDINPRIVITHDLRELREALLQAQPAATTPHRPERRPA